MKKLWKAMHKEEKGFTLVELMVVVVIIAVLVAIAIPIYSGIQRSAAESAHDANVRTLKGAASIWHAEHWTGSENLELIKDGGFGPFCAERYGGDNLENEDFYFGNYIEGGSPPTVPDLVQGRGGISEDQKDYLVILSYDGEVNVTPGIGAYHGD